MAILDAKQQDFTMTESAIYEEVLDFRHNRRGVRSWARKAVDTRLERLTERLEETTTGEAMDRGAGVLLEVLNDVSVWSVREQQIWDHFRDAGHHVADVIDVQKLDLEVIEDALGRLELKYRIAAFTEGVSIGSFGWVGIWADVPTIVGMSLRAIAEYATYYGFDISRRSERTFGLLVLALASASGETRDTLFERIETFAMSEGPGAPDTTSTHITSEAVEQLVVRLVRGKIAQSVPLFGALIGGSFNESFVRHICQTAHQVYRLRWLLRRHETQA